MTRVSPRRLAKSRHGLVLPVAAWAAFAFLAAFALEPLVQQAVGSFFYWHDVRPDAWAGLHEYSAVLADATARSALVHTVVYVALTVPLEVGIGLAGAWVVSRVRRGKRLLTAIYVVPLAVPWASVATLVLGFFNAGGVLDTLRADVFGSHQLVLWLQDPTLAFVVIVLVGVWKGLPWCFLFMLAALGTCNDEVFEAARVDGARGLSFWLRVVVPAVWPMLVFVTIFRIFGEAQTYTSVALLTQGGPANATQLASTYDNTLAFQYFDFGQASALGTITGAALLVVAAGGFFMLRRRPDVFSGELLGLPGRLVEMVSATFRGAPVVAGARSAGTTPPVSIGDIGVTRLNFWRSLRRSVQWDRRAKAGVLCLAAVVTLLPLVGGLPGGALHPDLALPWSVVASGLLNSSVLTVATLLGTVLLGVPAAYVLARGTSRLRSALFVVVLFAMAVPGALVILPQYQEMSWLGLVDSRLGLVLLYVAANLPLAIFFLRGAFASVPEGYVESMRVDGASSLRIVTRLFVPLSLSTLVTVAVFVVVQVWNEVPLAATLLDNQALYPLPLIVALGTGGTASLGASWISIAPPLFVFLASQRAFQRGMLTGTLL